MDKEINPKFNEVPNKLGLMIGVHNNTRRCTHVLTHRLRGSLINARSPLLLPSSVHSLPCLLPPPLPILFSYGPSGLTLIFISQILIVFTLQ